MTEGPHKYWLNGWMYGRRSISTLETLYNTHPEISKIVHGKTSIERTIYALMMIGQVYYTPIQIRIFQDILSNLRVTTDETGKTRVTTRFVYPDGKIDNDYVLCNIILVDDDLTREDQLNIYKALLTLISKYMKLGYNQLPTLDPRLTLCETKLNADVIAEIDKINTEIATGTFANTSDGTETDDYIDLFKHFHIEICESIYSGTVLVVTNSEYKDYKADELLGAIRFRPCSSNLNLADFFTIREYVIYHITNIAISLKIANIEDFLEEVENE